MFVHTSYVPVNYDDTIRTHAADLVLKYFQDKKNLFTRLICVQVNTNSVLGRSKGTHFKLQAKRRKTNYVFFLFSVPTLEEFSVFWVILFKVKVVNICFSFYMNKQNLALGVSLFKITPLKDF